MINMPGKEKRATAEDGKMLFEKDVVRKISKIFSGIVKYGGK